MKLKYISYLLIFSFLVFSFSCDDADENTEASEPLLGIYTISKSVLTSDATSLNGAATIPSGTNITSSGLFDPAAAGAGTFTITYTIGVDTCQSTDTYDITVTDTDDGDGVPSDVEAIDGTDPNDECSLLTASISLPVTSTADCDGDGVPNNVEDTDGTDPQDECSFLTASISVAVTSTADCDGDGVPSNVEAIDGTDPNDDCSFLTASISGPVTSTGDSCADVSAAAVAQLCQIMATTPPSSVPELQDAVNSIADTLLASTDICEPDCDIAGQLNALINALISPEPH